MKINSAALLGLFFTFGLVLLLFFSAKKHQHIIFHEYGSYSVILTETGAEKIMVIKALRSTTNMSLTTAFHATEHTPAIIAQNVSKDTAHQIQEMLKEAGAQVQVQHPTILKNGDDSF